MIDIRRYEMVVRLNGFGAAHTDQFPATSLGGTLFATLATRLGELEPRVVAQAASKKAARQTITTKNAIRQRMRDLLAMVTRTAKLVTASMPGLAIKFRAPKTHSDQRLVAEARAIVQEATPFGDAIVAHHLPSTILDDVMAAIDEFQAVIKTHATAKEARAAASAAISASLAGAVAIAKQLDTIVANQCGSDPATLAEWKSARHISLVSVPYPSRKQPEGPTPGPSPAPAPKAA